MPDVVPNVITTDVRKLRPSTNGAMDSFNLLGGCQAARGYACYTQATAAEIPDLTALAIQYAISDRTFEMDTIPSWGAHLEFAAGTLDGFSTNPGNDPSPGTAGGTKFRDWGCRSWNDVAWGPT